METKEIESEDELTDKNSRFYKDTRNPNYVLEIFEDVGRSVAIALLEFAKINPISRMPLSLYKNLDSIRKELIVQNTLLPYEQMRDLRKEVHKEREAMKAKQKKLQEGLKARQEAQLKRQQRAVEQELAIQSGNNYISPFDTRLPIKAMPIKSGLKSTKHLIP